MKALRREVFFLFKNWSRGAEEQGAKKSQILVAQKSALQKFEKGDFRYSEAFLAEAFL